VLNVKLKSTAGTQTQWQRKYWWPDRASSDIQAFIVQCELCGVANRFAKKPPLQPIIAKDCRERCQFDLCNHLSSLERSPGRLF
jgi:hypothetical protein